MTRFDFSLSTHNEEMCLAGTVKSGTLSDALQAIAREAPASRGDQLDIGVPGFPPARFYCVPSDDGVTMTWVAAGKMAA